MGSLVKELLLYLKTLSDFKFISIYNNQFDFLDESGSYSFPFPAVFLELETTEFGQLLDGYQGVDVTYRFHIAMDFYNSALDQEQNLLIFDLRDKLVQALSIYKPLLGGAITKTNEIQDYNHSNVYHYILEYQGHFIDNTAVIEPTYTTGNTNLIIQK